jgi:hypothetical protein
VGKGRGPGQLLQELQPLVAAAAAAAVMMMIVMMKR